MTFSGSDVLLIMALEYLLVGAYWWGRGRDEGPKPPPKG